MTMRERMESGKLFTDYCEGLPEDRNNCKRIMLAFNATTPDEIPQRKELLAKLLGKKVSDWDEMPWVEPPFRCCYGYNISMGEFVYINMGCTFVDDGKITIGSRVLFGPSVIVATVGHPIIPNLREYQYTDPVTIGDDCWIGAGSIICPGVTIGSGSVIGAGSVVLHDIPENVVAAGNPCKVIRPIDERDKQFYYKDRPITPEDLAEEKALR